KKKVRAQATRSEGKEYPGELARASINYVKRSMIAYLDGKKNLNWILGVIRSSGLRGELLMRYSSNSRATEGRTGGKGLWRPVEKGECCNRRA
ncbi:MAG: hypothetical protein QI199_05655, partial [Candidatus Korarchaeota archaeon]|nr:hypothetical protein [Candidatus Korarchaeota archaeon]